MDVNGSCKTQHNVGAPAVPARRGGGGGVGVDRKEFPQTSLPELGAAIPLHATRWSSSAVLMGFRSCPSAGSVARLPHPGAGFFLPYKAVTKLPLPGHWQPLRSVLCARTQVAREGPVLVFPFKAQDWLLRILSLHSSSDSSQIATSLCPFHPPRFFVLFCSCFCFCF